jgi:hypothetical protein
MPVLLVSFIGSYRFFRSMLFAAIWHPKGDPLAVCPAFGDIHATHITPFAASDVTIRALLPFYIHSLALTLLLLVSAHTQIALRVCATDPTIWWSLAGISFQWRGRIDTASVKRGLDPDRGMGEAKQYGMTLVGRIWTWWSIVYGAISIVLWAGHYPPA